MVEDFERLKKQAEELAKKYDCTMELHVYDYYGGEKVAKLKLNKDI